MIDDRLDHKPEKTAIVNNSLTTNFMWLQSTAGQRCDFFEKQWLDCASRLGRDRAEIECAAQLRDLKQCSEMDLAYKRYQRMQEERIKKGKQFQDPPPYGTLQQDRFKAFVH